MAAKNTQERYMAFNVDVPVGKFTAIVKMESEMNAAMARKDALNAALGEFYGAQSVSVRGDGREITELPADNFPCKGSQGWAWMVRGWMPELEVKAVAAPVRASAFQPTSAQLIESIKALLEEANSVWGQIPDAERARLNNARFVNPLNKLDLSLKNGLEAANRIAAEMNQADMTSSPEP